MKPAEHYGKGREQTYLKHFFLEKYLERLAFKVGSWADDFVYVDGFAGPWHTDGAEHEDSSFKIALATLRKVRDGLDGINRRPRMRCLFVEKNPKSFARLKEIAKGEHGLDEVEALEGELENRTPDVLRFVGRSFALFFIDPTGWKGVGVNQIAPLLRHRPGEVIVNFMFDYINRRFLTDAHFDELYGIQGSREVLERLVWAEGRMVGLYRDRLKDVGAFDYATFTRIKKPTAERTYFYLVYGTRHPIGVKTFRQVEKQFVEEQEVVRRVAKQARRVQRTKQEELFSAAVEPGPPTFEEERNQGLRLAETKMVERVQAASAIRCGDLVPDLLQVPLVWESDLGEIARRLAKEGHIEIIGMSGRQQLLRDDMLLKHKGTRSA